MTSSPVTSWQIDGKTTESVTGFLFLASSITADGDCSHEMRSFLLLGRKAMTNLDSTLRTRDIKKKKKRTRDITLLTKVHLVKAMVFPVIIYGCEGWTIKKAECRRIYAFELWY